MQSLSPMTHHRAAACLARALVRQARFLLDWPRHPQRADAWSVRLMLSAASERLGVLIAGKRLCGHIPTNAADIPALTLELAQEDMLSYKIMEPPPSEPVAPVVPAESMKPRPWWRGWMERCA